MRLTLASNSERVSPWLRSQKSSYPKCTVPSATARIFSLLQPKVCHEKGCAKISLYITKCSVGFSWWMLLILLKWWPCTSQPAQRGQRAQLWCSRSLGAILGQQSREGGQQVRRTNRACECLGEFPNEWMWILYIPHRFFSELSNPAHSESCLSGIWSWLYPKFSSAYWRPSLGSSVIFKQYEWSALRWTCWAEGGEPDFPLQT